MAVSVAEIMRHVNNYFERACGDTLAADAPYAAIEGLGVFSREELEAMQAEPPTNIWSLYPPPDFLALCREIEAYAEAHPVGAPRSESFGAYRYEGGGEGWETAFAARLAPYRRMFTEVKV